MIKQIILETDYATLWFYPEPKIIHHQFQPKATSKNFRKVLMKGLEVFEEKGAVKWLSDERANIKITPEDEEWSEHFWKPKAIKAGWKYWAIIMPGKLLERIKMERFIEIYKNLGVTVEIFPDPDEALKWLACV